MARFVAGIDPLGDDADLDKGVMEGTSPLCFARLRCPIAALIHSS